MSAAPRVLVTGASGFIGRATLAGLLRAGYEVHAVSSRAQLNSSPLADVRWHTCDLLHPGSAEPLAAAIGATHCLHLAWYAVHGKFWTAPENLEWVEASLRLADALIQHGCQRMVVSGTCAEYDWNHGACDETETPLEPATLYGASKNGLRNALTEFCARAGVSLAWGRVFLLYGPGEPEKRFIPAVIQACVRNEAARCSHGRQIRDFLHVQDVADAFVALLASAVEGPVNIGSGQPVALREVALKIASFAGAGSIEFGAIPAAPNDPPVLVPRVERLRNEVGWKSAISLDDGLRSTIKYWQRRS